MKNKWITRIGIWLCLLLTGYMGQAQTTSLLVGTVKNGVGVITNSANATKILKANLPQNATVSEILLEYSEYDGRYYLTAKVSNDPISSIGIGLTVTDGNITAIAGPGIEYTCSGYNCGTCRLIISKWEPRCECRNPPEGTWRCDMTSKITISL